MSEKYLKFCIYVILCSTVPPPIIDGWSPCGDFYEVKMLHLWERACEMNYDKTGCCYNATLYFFSSGKVTICRSLGKFIDEILTKLDKNYKDLKIEKKKKEEELKKEERMYIS